MFRFHDKAHLHSLKIKSTEITKIMIFCQNKLFVNLYILYVCKSIYIIFMYLYILYVCKSIYIICM